MGKRGAKPLEERMGYEKFRMLLKSLTVNEIARLVCIHFVEEIDKERCKACRRAIYRAKNRLEQKDKAERNFSAIDNFDTIPEIRAFRQYMQAKHVKVNAHVNRLRRCWKWIKQSGDERLILTQRPALWNAPHVQFILKKVDEEKANRYEFKQSLRRLFESMNMYEMLKNPLLTASAKDMRSQNGKKRMKDMFTPFELTHEILPKLNDDEKFALKMHITCKSREGDRGKGSIIGAQWKDVNWEDNFYGERMVTISIFEPKTKGGTWWRHIPLDLWFKGLAEECKERCLNGDLDGYVVPFSYETYKNLWNKISELTGKDYEPHDCRRSPSGWLRDLGLSDLAIGQYDPNSGEAVGYTGVGWENANMFFQRYGKMNPLAIYDKSQRLDISLFDGFINKILENC